MTNEISRRREQRINCGRNHEINNMKNSSYLKDTSKSPLREQYTN